MGKIKILEEKIIKTFIYGVKPRGNRTERILKRKAKLAAKEYPLTNQRVQNDININDYLSGEKTEELAQERTNQLELVLNQGGFSLKESHCAKEILHATCSC